MSAAQRDLDEHQTQQRAEALKASRERAKAIAADPQKRRALLTRKRGVAVPMSADDFRRKYGIRASHE